MEPASRLILASASPRRRDLLADAGFRFEVRPADLDEEAYAAADAAELARLLAVAKARAVAAGHPNDVVLGSDTTVAAHDGTLLGKPIDAEDAARILRKLGEGPHQVCTGIAVVRGEELASATETAVVNMRPMTPAELAAYLDGGEWRGKAGAYGIQNDDLWVTRLVGDRDTVMGLPVRRTRELLARFGIRPDRP